MTGRYGFDLMDNAVVFGVSRALDAGVLDPLLWGSLFASLAVAFVVAVPVNRALVGRGRGHGVVPRVAPVR